MSVPTDDFVARIAVLEHRQDEQARKIDAIHTAFVPDDLGRPGFDGHRLFHLAQMRKAQEFDSIKLDVTKKIAWGVFIFLVSAVSIGTSSWFVKFVKGI